MKSNGNGRKPKHCTPRESIVLWRGQMLLGNGCTQHSDCLTCPFEDCVVGHKSFVYASRKPEAKETPKPALGKSGRNSHNGHNGQSGGIIGDEIELKVGLDRLDREIGEEFR